MKRFWFDTLMATIFIFIVMYGVSKVTQLPQVNAFDPISNALADFDLSDFAFNKFRNDPDAKERELLDKIVIVNIGEQSRREFALAFQNIIKYKPRVVGVDGFYNCEGGIYDIENCPQLADTLGNLLLASAFQQTKNLVLVSKLLQTDSLAEAGDFDFYDSIEVADEMFRLNAKNGYASLPTDAKYQEDVKICKTFFPQRVVNKKKELAFGTQVAMLYDSVTTKKFLARNNTEEVINFVGNVEHEVVKLNSLKSQDLGTTDVNRKLSFLALDVDDVINEKFEPSAIEDKIVLFGYLGSYIGDPAWEDKFFTPLNKKIGGRANPDMFGLIVHANIVATILSDDYIDVASQNLEYFIAFVVCFFNVALFSFINKKWPVIYDGVGVLIQVIEIFLCGYAVITLLADHHFKSTLGVTMGVLALVGPCYDLYAGLIKEGIEKLRKFWLTRKQKRVLKT
ncbi:MAG TPA: CHASE2 domain-containing protein [Cyclobacteriaceae bacterium]|jgi:CHASE2 domain-containing sensor protein|nr:CHASE2 domain-containing protein [Cyclobacteriaceae bacterium]